MDNAENKRHSIEINSKITVLGIEKLIKLEKEEVIIKLNDCCLFLAGRDFNAEKLNIAEGSIILRGTLISLKYSKNRSKESFFKRLIK